MSITSPDDRLVVMTKLQFTFPSMDELREGYLVHFNVISQITPDEVFFAEDYFRRIRSIREQHTLSLLHEDRARQTLAA
jgi:hypothetical protein